MTWPQRLVIIVLLLCNYGIAFSSFLYRPVTLWLFLATAVLLFPLFVFSLEALIRRRWRALPLFAVVWLLVFLPETSVDPQPRDWARTLGFFVKTRLVNDYRSGCHLTDFTENDVRQTIGVCEVLDEWGGQFFNYVVYDTTGELMLPVSQRTPEWAQAASQGVAAAVVSEEHPAYPLFGHYYAVPLTILQLPQPGSDGSVK
jgi:hypothetical protein